MQYVNISNRKQWLAEDGCYYQNEFEGLKSENKYLIDKMAELELKNKDLKVDKDFYMLSAEFEKTNKSLAAKERTEKLDRLTERMSQVARETILKELGAGLDKPTFKNGDVVFCGDIRGVSFDEVHAFFVKYCYEEVAKVKKEVDRLEERIQEILYAKDKVTIDYVRKSGLGI